MYMGLLNFNSIGIVIYTSVKYLYYKLWYLYMYIPIDENAAIYWMWTQIKSEKKNLWIDDNFGSDELSWLESN